MSSPMTLIIPHSITDSMLIASSIPESEVAWVSGGTYAVGYYCRYGHTVYACTTAHSGVSTPPDQDKANWLFKSPTNRWMCLDSRTSTKTAQATSISYTLRPGLATPAVALLGMVGVTSARIRVMDPVYGTAYDKTTDLHPVPRRSGWWQWFFGRRSAPGRLLALDLPSLPNADIQIDLTGSADLQIGSLVIGVTESFGRGVKYGAGTSIVDYSQYIENQWGDMALTRGNYADRNELEILIDTYEVDVVRDLLASLRATPCVAIGSNRFGSLTVFGFPKEFRVVISGPVVSECTLEMRGMT